ncbi:MAG: hypothetical protein KKB51_15335 [Candidatus Riflebacteria bacterium]|nr:hypothetical protein [Candidatus Riflebacteria bacterium]
MTKKSDFDPKEWNSLMHFACIGVSYKYSTRDVHSLGDIVGFMRELFSVQKYLASAREKYGNLELLREVINELLVACKSKQDSLSNGFDDFSNLGPPVAKVNQLLADKSTPEEARAMRAFVYELAFEAANAAGDGFLGTGPKISAAENEFLHELKRALIDA